jgi:thiol-disulfide isomerase/thioredoxin
MLALVVGAAAPAASQAAPAAAGLDLAPYRGKVVYLDFWASWCGPCKLSFPYMQKMVSRYPQADFVVVTVNLDRAREKADGFIREVGSRLPVVYDPSGAVARQYAVKEMPSSVLIDRKGKIRHVHKGFFLKDAPTYEAHIEALIDER